MLVDSHCHLDFPDLEDQADAVVTRAHDAGVGCMLTISTRISHVERYQALAERYAQVFFSIGTHPHQAAEEPDTDVETLVGLSNHPKCIAIGEAGLDYHYNKSPPDIQRKVFLTHIRAAQETGLPLIIHARNADAEMMDILTAQTALKPFKAVLHCYSSGVDLAKCGLDLGLYVSFSGIITFKKSDELRHIAGLVPHDKVLVETDAPYLAPEPHRGKTNEPAFVKHTAATLAQVYGMSAEALAHQTTRNFFHLFTKARLS